MSLKLLSLNFEQLENKIALSALPNSGYRDLGRKAHSNQQIVRQAKKPPLYVPNIPFNTLQKPITPLAQISKISPATPTIPLAQISKIPPITQTITLSQTSNADDNVAKQTNNGRSSLPLFVMSVTPSGAIHCVLTPGKVILMD